VPRGGQVAQTTSETPRRLANKISRPTLLDGRRPTARLLAVEARHVWVMEYDVDYAGCWAQFFA